MAGAWIKMRTDLDTNPHVIELAALLGVPEIHAVGMLWKVWSWADSHCLDGNAIRVTCVTLDRFTGVTGFADALRKVGWLEGRDGALTFPRFAEHNGQTAKNRAETAGRVAKHRNANRVTDVTQKPLPEKNRGEKRRIEDTHSHSRTREAWLDHELVRESPELQDAIRFWCAAFSSTHGHGRDDDDIRIDMRLAEALSKGWDAARIAKSIRFSVTKLAKSWLDPDADFEQLAKDRASGARRPKAEIPITERC